MTNKYKHVIWDWNGTIIDDALFCVSIINRILAKRGIDEISYQTYLKHFDFPVTKFYEKVGLDFSKEPFQVSADEYIKLYNRNCLECSLHKGIEDILSFVKDAGIDQSILSAYKQDYLLNAVDHFSLSSFFNFIYGQDNHYGHGKIDVGIRLLENIKLEKKKIVMIGDTTHDFEVAGSLGIDCILVNGGHQQKEKLVEGPK